MLKITRSSKVSILKILGVDNNKIINISGNDDGQSPY